MNHQRIANWAPIGAAVLVGWIGIEAQKPPRALGLDAPATAFSAGRAQKHLARIAQAPHPMGSAEAEKVRAYLVTQLKELGLEPSIQTPYSSENPARNVLARIRGTGPPGRKALLLSAHYDSVAAGPGAGDNASGVAVILEAVRALLAGPPPVRDVIVLFDDGEEIDFGGSIAFTREHAWNNDVGVVLNFDARGNSGPSVMFETSDDNGWLITQYAQAVSHPLATSLSMDVYKAMPNDTDLTVYKQANLAGLNFAFGAGVAAYHSPHDIPAAMDPDTLQHQGQNALQCLRWFTALDLEKPHAPGVTYFSLFSRFVVAYPMTFVLPLALATAALYGLVAAWLVVRGSTLREILAGAGLLFLAQLAALAILTSAYMIMQGINITRSSFNQEPFHFSHHDLLILSVASTLAGLATISIYRRLGGMSDWTALCAGAWLWWVVLGCILAAIAPGSSYFFVWPSVFGLCGLAASRKLGETSLRARGAAFLGSLPALILVLPLLRTMFDSLGLGMAAPIVGLAVLFTAAILPLVSKGRVSQIAGLPASTLTAAP